MSPPISPTPPHNVRTHLAPFGLRPLLPSPAIQRIHLVLPFSSTTTFLPVLMRSILLRPFTRTRVPLPSFARGGNVLVRGALVGGRLVERPGFVVNAADCPERTERRRGGRGESEQTSGGGGQGGEEKGARSARRRDGKVSSLSTGSLLLLFLPIPSLSIVPSTHLTPLPSAPSSLSAMTCRPRRRRVPTSSS